MALATVQDILPDWVGWASMDMSYGDQTSGQGSGETIVKQLRPPLWTLHAVSKTLRASQLRFWKAKLDGLSNGKKLFLGYDFANFYPLNYPNGSWPAGPSFDPTTPTVLAIGGDGVSISLQGLPSGYKGSIGDMVQIAYGSGSPVALALMEVVEGFTAGGDGTTGSFEVRGDIPAAMAEGDAVSVKRPSCHMMIVPGSVNAPKDISGGGVLSFDALQVPTP